MTEKEELSNNIIDRALSGKHTPTELLMNTGALEVAFILKRGLKKLYKEFYKMSNAFYQAYLLQQKQGEDNVSLLFKHREILTCAKYYEYEYDKVCYEISEFFSYMTTFGNFINTLFGDDRPESEMYDHLNPPFKGDLYE